MPCGCGDKPLVNCSPCVTPPCNNGDLCPETFSAGCVVYTGDNIVDANGGVIVAKGDRVDAILQKLILFFVNPGCAYPSSPCQSVLGLQSSQITATTASFKWLPIQTATQYQLEYHASNSTTWLVNPAIGNSAAPMDNIGILTPNTTYYIRVNSTCPSGMCTSLTISITTPAS